MFECHRLGFAPDQLGCGLAGCRLKRGQNPRGIRRPQRYRPGRLSADGRQPRKNAGGIQPITFDPAPKERPIAAGGRLAPSGQTALTEGGTILFSGYGFEVVGKKLVDCRRTIDQAVVEGIHAASHKRPRIISERAANTRYARPVLHRRTRAKAFEFTREFARIGARPGGPIATAGS